MQLYNDLFVLDIDECEKDTDDCDLYADCKNTNGSFNCTCQPGYSGNGTSCTCMIYN